MFNRTLAPLLCLAATVSPAFAGEKWAPIPDEVWNLKQDPAKVETGAIFLNVGVSLDNRWVEYSYRLRILSEAGKAAAQFSSISDRAFDIDGRTVTRDGKVVTFNSRKDFQTKTVLETHWDKVQTTVVIPPGLTDDCVVEFRFKVPYDFVSSSSFGSMDSWRLAMPYPIQTCTVEVDKYFAWAWSLLIAPGVKSAQEERSGRHIVTLRDVPAVKPLPYSLDSIRPVGRLVAFPNPQEFLAAAREGTETYWKLLATDLWKPFMESNIDKGRAYRALSESLRANLPEDPQRAAMELKLRLDAAIKNVSHPTAEEKATLPKDLTPENIKSGDLDAAAKKKATDDLGFQHLYYWLLKDAKIPLEVVLVADKDLRIVNPRNANFQQFTHVMFGVEAPGKPTLWVDPTLRFQTPGLIHEDFQGTQAMLVDAQTWTYKFTPLGAQPPHINKREFEYHLDITPEEEAFSIKAAFHGIYAHRVRMEYIGRDASGQAKALKEYLESGSKDLSIAKAQVQHVTEPGHDPEWTVEGAQEQELGRRHAIYPFPMMPWPITIPDQLDALRSEPIIFPFLSSHHAVSRFKVPKGYKVITGVDLNQANAFGRVTWHAEATPEGECVVEMDTTAESLNASSVEYAKFKAYLGWIQDACQRQVVLEKL